MVKVLSCALMASMIGMAVMGWVAVAVRQILDNLPIVY
jgi:hypothetical protein